MTQTGNLSLRGRVELPAHSAGGFDHGDVHLLTGRVFVAHTANDTVEVIDGESLRLERTLPECPEGSGVLVAHGPPDLVFAAARGAGSVSVFDPISYQLQRRVTVGPKPNGLAWDPDRRRLLVADVESYDALLIDPATGAYVTSTDLPEDHAGVFTTRRATASW